MGILSSRFCHASRNVKNFTIIFSLPESLDIKRQIIVIQNIDKEPFSQGGYASQSDHPSPVVALHYFALPLMYLNHSLVFATLIGVPRLFDMPLVAFFDYTIV